MQNKSQRIRIKENGWAGYTGHFGGIEFKDGLSVEIVDPAQMTRLGSIISIVAVDTDAEVGAGAALRGIQDTPAPQLKELPESSTVEESAETETASTARHTREELEAIADKNGIAGLRAIAEPLGVKGRGISELIEEILKAP